MHAVDFLVFLMMLGENGVKPEKMMTVHSCGTLGDSFVDIYINILKWSAHIACSDFWNPAFQSWTQINDEIGAIKWPSILSKSQIRHFFAVFVMFFRPLCAALGTGARATETTNNIVPCASGFLLA